MSLLVRTATNEDVEGIVHVIRTVYDEYAFPWEEDGYHADLYDIDTAYTSEGNTFYVAEWEGQVVGTAALELFDRVPGKLGVIAEYEGYRRVAGTDCSVERLYVHPDARRRGIARALMRRVLEDATKEGRTHMEIWSDKRLVDAHRLYQGLGATVAGERLCDDPELSPEWGMVLAIR